MDMQTCLILTCSFVILHCRALVVEKQPVMQNYSQRPLILKVGVQFSVTLR